MTDEEFAAIPRAANCPENWPSREQAEQMRADRLKWEKLYAAIPPRAVPHDIAKLKRERPEMFDFADIPDPIEDPKYAAAMEKRRPQWIKDLLAE